MRNKLHELAIIVVEIFFACKYKVNLKGKCKVNPKKLMEFKNVFENKFPPVFEKNCIFFMLFGAALQPVKNHGVACFSLLSMEARRRGCLLTPLTKLHLPVHIFNPSSK